MRDIGAVSQRVEAKIERMELFIIRVKLSGLLVGRKRCMGLIRACLNEEGIFIVRIIKRCIIARENHLWRRDSVAAFLLGSTVSENSLSPFLFFVSCLSEEFFFWCWLVTGNLYNERRKPAARPCRKE